MLMVRWLLQEGTTRSHPELGRETSSRQWYFGLSRGRVGHCQFFPKDHSYHNLTSFLPPCYSLTNTVGSFFMGKRTIIFLDSYKKAC